MTQRPPPPAPAAPFDALAIVAFVLAFTVPPGAIVCGHLSLRRIAATGERGRELASAGTILGHLFTAGILLFLVIWFAVLLGILGVFGAVLWQVPRG